MPMMVAARAQQIHAASPAQTRMAAALPAMLLFLAACVDGAPSAGAAKADAGPAPGPAAAGAVTGERRCGWLHNPTPGNWWLVDRDGEWILATQGGPQAPGMDEMPDMTTLGWVEVNGHYGYGCACMTLGVDPVTRRVERIDSASARALRQCRADRRLPQP